MCLRTLKNSGRAVQTDPTLLRFGDHGTKKCWELLAQKFDRLQTFATTCNRVCKRTQHVTSDNVAVVGQQCCVRLHGALHASGLVCLF